MKEGARDIKGKAIIVSLSPDVCKTPMGNSTPPVPYPIVAHLSDDGNTSPDVFMIGKRAHNMGSVVTQVKGDEAGKAGGVKSGTVDSVCHPKTSSATVRINGKHALRHGDEWYMNNKNTVGKLNYLEDINRYGPTPQAKAFGDPPGSDEQVLSWGDGDVVLKGQAAEDQLDDLPTTLPENQPPVQPPSDEDMSPALDLAENLIRGVDRNGDVFLRSAPLTGSVPTIRSDIGGLEWYKRAKLARGYPEESLSEIDAAIAELERLESQIVSGDIVYDDYSDVIYQSQSIVQNAVLETQDVLYSYDQSDGVRVTGSGQPDPCKIGPYSEMRSVCARQGMQAQGLPSYLSRPESSLVVGVQAVISNA